MGIRLSANLLGKMGSQNLPWSIGLEFGATADVSSADLLIAANAVMTALATDTHVRGGLPTTSHIAAIRLAIHNPDTGPETSAAVSTHATIPGTVAVTGLPPQLCAVTTLRTGIPGRSFRGRVYWPALVVDSNGELNPSDLGTYNNAVQYLAQIISAQVATVGANLAWYVWSRTRGAGTAISQVSVGSRSDTQRRRNSGVDAYTNFSVT